jgi:hypothetical protein
MHIAPNLVGELIARSRLVGLQRAADSGFVHPRIQGVLAIPT